MKTKRECLDEVENLIGVNARWGDCNGDRLTNLRRVFWFDCGMGEITPHIFCRIMDWMTHNPDWTWGIDSCGFFMNYTGPETENGETL